jgi:TM2 domain-containing membrane protein YozV
MGYHPSAMADTRAKALDEKFCESCGEAIKIGAEICPKCGVRQRAAMGSKSKLAAGLLGIFLGGIGIHKFYLGQTGMGVVYLVFCWTFIPAIIGFIEGIVLLSMNDDRFAQKYSAA